MMKDNGRIPESGKNAKAEADAGVGARIRRRRRAAGMKQATLAHEAGVSAAQICHIEKDRVRPSLKTLGKIAAALGVPVADLLENAETGMRNAECGVLPSYAASSSGSVFSGDALASDVLAGGEAGGWRWARGDERQPGGDEERASGDDRREAADSRRARGDARRMTGDWRPGIVKEPVTGLICVHDPRDSAVDRRVRARLAKEIAAWKKTEADAGVDRRLALPLFFPDAAEFGALLAREVRNAAGLGPAATCDLMARLEDAGLRILETKLPAGLDSWSVWDPHDGNAFVFLRAAASAERKRFRLAYELGHLARLVSGGFRPVRDVGPSRKLSRAFAAALLLPEEAVRGAAHALALGPGDWTWELLLLQKERFGVSAETYLYRVEELGMLAPAERRAFRARLKEYYAACRAAGRKDFEPRTGSRSHGRSAALKARAAGRRLPDAGGAKPETARLFRQDRAPLRPLRTKRKAGRQTR